jgi:hypothetical protein
MEAAYQMNHRQVEKSERCEHVHYIYANPTKEATDFANRPFPGKTYSRRLKSRPGFMSKK